LNAQQVGLRYLRAGAGMALFLGLAMIWLLRRGPPRREGRMAKAGLAVLFWGFGLQVRRHGVPLAPEATLYAANHVSWTDIPVLAWLLDAGFIAKAEVAGWPLIGALAARHGTLFIDRERRGEVRAQAAAVEDRLAAASGLVLFPEGTTSDGSDQLPFRSSLFAQAAARGSRVQPITIRASRRDGRPFTPEQRRVYAWIDDDGLLPHALALAASGGACIDVWFETPITSSDRKALARASRAAIAARLTGHQAAALNLAT
jgi:1-acyl-sn-glycerol-3-phosphate acyltransferase